MQRPALKDTLRAYIPDWSWRPTVRRAKQDSTPVPWNFDDGVSPRGIRNPGLDEADSAAGAFPDDYGADDDLGASVSPRGSSLASPNGSFVRAGGGQYGMDVQPALVIGRKRFNHHTLVYQYRLCYTMPLYCAGALSRSVT